jgi:hypothetical protein
LWSIKYFEIPPKSATILPMSQELIAHTLEFIGDMLIAVAVIRVHLGVLKEHKIDKQVLDVIRGEILIASLGAIFLTTSFVLRLFIF